MHSSVSVSKNKGSMCVFSIQISPKCVIYAVKCSFPLILVCTFKGTPSNVYISLSETHLHFQQKNSFKSSIVIFVFLLFFTFAFFFFFVDCVPASSTLCANELFMRWSASILSSQVLSTMKRRTYLTKSRRY